MVSPRKPSSLIQTSSRLTNNLMATTKSCESLLSASSKESASLIYQSKLPQQLHRGSGNVRNAGARQASLLNPSSVIQQRVMSARNLRIKTFQNQLADAQHEISNLAHENRMLRTLHKRQDNALAKYEATNAELPRLLNSHAEELRVWQTKCRNLQSLNKDLEVKLKQKEALILSLSDQNKHYSQLNKDKNLDERQRLQEKLRSLEQRLQEKDNDMKLMARKVQLESKNFKQQLLNEQKKNKEMMLKLEKAKLELSGYHKLEEYSLGDKTPMGRRPKITITEDSGKIDKLEKSLESLEKAIEKNNQSELHALTDVLDKDFDSFEDEQNILGSARSETESKSMRSDSKLMHLDVDLKMGKSELEAKLERCELDSTVLRNIGKITLPPAHPPKRDSSKSVLGQALANKSRESKIKPPTRLRSGGSESRDADSMSKFSSELKSINKSVQSAKSQAHKSITLSSDISGSFEYDDDDYEATGHEDASDEDESEGKNRMTLAAYAAYIDNDESDTGFNDIVDVTEEGEEVDDDDNDNDSVILNTKVRNDNMKEEISSIRKQISDDYKEREAFLDTFCRQTSGSRIRDDPASKKRNSIANTTSHITAGRKNQLLAALKAIDDNKSQD